MLTKTHFQYSQTCVQWLPVYSDYLCRVTTWLLGLYFCSLFAHLFHTTSKAHIQVRRSNSSNYQRQSTFSRFLLAYCNWNCDNFYWTDTFFDQSRPKVWCLLDRLQMYIKDKHENPKCETACNFPEMIRDMSEQKSISIVCE